MNIIRRRSLAFLKMTIPDGIRNVLRPLVFRARQARVYSRCLISRERLTPKFLIIGAMKAGSTSLFNYIAYHPAFRSPMIKEIDYFNHNSHRSLNWYLANFPRANKVGRPFFTGEASTGYLPNPRAASRIRKFFPDMKIIVVLRDPIDRALSHYFHEVRSGREIRPLAEALRAPEADSGYLLSSNEEYPYYCGLLGKPLVKRTHAAVPAAKPAHHGYIFESRYFDLLQPWQENFAPEQIILVQSERLFSDPQTEIDRLFDFLGIADVPTLDTAHVFNKGKRADVAAEDRRLLEAALAETCERYDSLA